MAPMGASFHFVSRPLENRRISSVCAPPPPPPSLVGAYYLHPQTHVLFLHSDLLCNGTCSVALGAQNVLGGGGGGTGGEGGTNRKYPNRQVENFQGKNMSNLLFLSILGGIRHHKCIVASGKLSCEVVHQCLKVRFFHDRFGASIYSKNENRTQN